MLPILLVLSLSPACSDDTTVTPDIGTDVDAGAGDADAGDGVVGSVEIIDFAITENIFSVLSAIVEVETDVPARISVVLENVDTGATIEVPVTELGTEHEIGVIGMTAETEYTITIAAESEDGATGAVDPQSYTTRELPDDFPEMEVIAANADSMSPGYTMFPVSRWNPSLDQNYGWLIAIDNTGTVVWYYRAGIPVGDFLRLDNGNVLLILGVNAAREIDPMGNEQTFWFATTAGLDSMHHHISELPNGNVLVVGTDDELIDGYPAEGGGTAEYKVVGDTMHELSRDGSLVSTVSTFDFLDPLDVPEDLDDPYWDSFVDPFWDFLYDGNTRDWTHLNEVIVVDEDTYIVSIRHLNMIAKVDVSDPENPELIWRLGPEYDFEMVGEGLWNYHQHGPQLEEDGSLFVYDNGNHRGGIIRGPELFSRVVHYAVDEENMEVEQLWEYRGEEQYFATFVGGVQRLANGNVLVTDGGILSNPELRETDPDGARWGRIVEVTYEDDPEVLFTLEVRDSDEEEGYHVYQSQRFESLY